MSVNKAILIGRVGKDPEVKHLDGGTAVANFSLATSEKYKNKSGEMVENTEWHNIVLWRQLAELTEKYVHKGDQLYLEGKITTRNYDKDGTKHYVTEIVADQMRFLSSKNASPQGESQQSAPQQSVIDTTTDLPF